MTAEAKDKPSKVKTKNFVLSTPTLQATKLHRTLLLVAIYRQFANKITAAFPENEHLFIFPNIENEN